MNAEEDKNMSEIWTSIEVRLADHEADEKLRRLLEYKGWEQFEDRFLGIVSFTNSEGSRTQTEEFEDYCIEAGIAFDRQYEADLENAAEYRIFRPGENPIDALVEVDVYGKPYVWCQEIADIFANETMSDKEKMTRLLRCSEKNDFPCPLISKYRSSRESA